MKWRKFLSWLVIPAAMAGMVSVAHATMSMQTDRTLDSTLEYGGSGSGAFICNGPITREKSVSNDKKWAAWLQSCPCEVLKAYTDFNGVAHPVGPGTCQFKTIAMKIKGISTVNPNYQGFVFIQGSHKTTGLTSISPNGLIPTVKVDGQTYAVPQGPKLLRDSTVNELKAMSTSDSSGFKALGANGNSLSQALTKVTGEKKTLKISAKALAGIDATMESERELQEGSTAQPVVYENFDKDSVALIIKAVSLKLYPNGGAK